MSRREELADAAIRVVAAKGLKGLTHRAVDAEAAVPVGTASNYHRRRADLIDVVAARLEEHDFAVWATLGPKTESLPEFVDGLATYAELLAQGHSHLIRVRLALFLDAGDRFAPGYGRFLGAIAEPLRAFGVADPLPTATRMIDLLDGALLHAVTVRTGEPLAGEHLAPGLRALCGLPPQRD